MSGLGLNFDLEKHGAKERVRFDEAQTASSSASAAGSLAHRGGRSGASSTDTTPPGYVIDLPVEEKERRRRHGHRRVSTQALIQLASQTALSPRRLATLFVVCFSAAYLAAFVPIPSNPFTTQHATVSRAGWESAFFHADQVTPYEAARAARMERRQREGKDGKGERETAFFAAGGGGVGAHTWAVLGDELALGGRIVREHLPTRLTMGDVVAGKALQWFGLGKHRAIKKAPADNETAPSRSAVGKDLPHPSWEPLPARDASSFATTSDDDEQEELLLVSSRGGRQTVLRRLPLPFQKTQHSPASRFIEHREPEPGTQAAKKHAAAHGLYPEDVERDHHHHRDSNDDLDVHAVAAAAAASASTKVDKPPIGAVVGVVKKAKEGLRSEIEHAMQEVRKIAAPSPPQPAIKGPARLDVPVPGRKPEVVRTPPVAVAVAEGDDEDDEGDMDAMVDEGEESIFDEE